MTKNILNKKERMRKITTIYIDVEVYQKFMKNLKKFNLTSSETIFEICSKLNVIFARGSGEVCLGLEDGKFYIEDKSGGKFKE